MDFITTTSDQPFNPKFVAFAEEMNAMQQDYDTHAKSAAKIRMMMIGRAEEEKRLYPQRSPEARYIAEGYKQNGWTADVVDNNFAAYKQYKALSTNVNPEFQALAEKASPTHLATFESSKDKTVVYDAAQHLKKTGSVPSVSKVKGHIAGHHTKDFVHISKLRSTPREEPETSSASIPNSGKDHLNQSLETIMQWLPTVEKISPGGKAKLQQLRNELDRVLSL